jgi:hypothetical protein
VRSRSKVWRKAWTKSRNKRYSGQTCARWTCDENSILTLCCRDVWGYLLL